MDKKTDDKDKIFEDTMQRILNIASWADDPYKATLLRVVHNAQEQWKGTGKEVTDPCPNCGKELHKDRHGCCRECGAYEFNTNPTK